MTEAGPPPVLVYGIHPVLELLRARSHEVERLFVAKERTGGLGRALRLARDASVPVSHLSRQALARKLGARAVHQSIAAQVAPLAYADVDSLCSEAVRDERAWLVLVDRVVDPGNLGAILRTAAAAGVKGVILGGEGTVGLTPAVAKVSAGAIERLPVGRDARPARRLQLLREAGFRALGLDPRARRSWDEVELGGRIVFVAGGEARGLRPGVAGACTERVAIPLTEKAESLNVNVALGVLLFEAVRQSRLTRSGS